MVYESLTKMLTIGYRDIFAVLNLYSAEAETVETRAISGDGALIRLASRILNFDIRRGGWKTDEIALKILDLPRFSRIGTLKDIAGGQLPAGALTMVERLTGIGSAWGRGLRSGGEAIGYIILLFRHTEPQTPVLERLEQIAECIEEMLPSLIAAEAAGCADGSAGLSGIAPGVPHEGGYLPKLFSGAGLDFTPDIYLGLDSDFSIVFANNAVQFLGADRQSLIGKSIDVLFADPARTTIRRELELLLRDPAIRAASRSLRISLQNGRSFRIVVSRTEPREDIGDAERVTLIMREISKEHSLSVAFLQREEMLRKLADAMNEAVWIEAVDPPQIIYTNPRVGPLFGIDPAVLANDPAHIYRNLKSDDGNPAENAITADLERPTQLESRIGEPGEHERWVRIRTYPILSADTQPLFIHIAEDVSRRRLAQRELEHQYESARMLLHEMNHRIKNNLSIVAGLTGIAADKVADPEARSEIQLLENKVSSIALVHELLFSAPDSSLMDFGAYCASLVTILAPTTPEGSPIRLETAFAKIAVSPSTTGILGMILTELITNAAKHAFPAGRRDPVIAVSFRGIGSRLELTVRDNGVAVNRNPLTSGGDSLGMEILRTLAEQIGGGIDFAQREGWKQFTVSWPGPDSAG